MGTWAEGPFDNDSAADFAYDIQEAVSGEERHDRLLDALSAGSVYLNTSHPRLSDEYAWGYQLEYAIAAAAFTADEHTGVKQFTNCSYARGVDDDMELKPYVDITMSDRLLQTARAFTAQMLKRMRRDRISEEWVQPVRDIAAALDMQKEHS